MFVNFDSIVERATADPRKQIMAVAAAEDESVISAVMKAMHDGIVDAIFVGDKYKIKQIIESMGLNPYAYSIQSVAHELAGQAAVSLVQGGAADFIMKGFMETREILGPIVKKENGLRTGRVISHFALNQLPGYHKLIANTDGGMILYPTLEEKKSIIENAVLTLKAMGYECPKVAVLAGIEKLNPKMQETVDADALMKMNQAGEIKGCVVEGPVSYDVALSQEIARHKSVPYTNCGDYDVLVVPNLATGNILGKCWSVTAGALMAGIVVGAKVPVVLTSRGATAEEKYNAIALAAVTAAGKVGEYEE